MNTITRLFDTAWCEALGWTILHSLWQAAVVALLLVLTMVWARKRTARLRYIMAISGLAVIFIAAAATFTIHYDPSSGVTADTALQTSMVDGEVDQLRPAATSITSAAADSSQHRAEIGQYIAPYLPLLVSLWLIGVLLLSLRLIGEAAYLQHLRNYGCSSLSGAWQAKISQLARAINLNQTVSVKETARVSSPMVVGLFRPLILLPVGLASGIEPGQLESILVHELAHIKRQDYLLNLIQSVVETLLFFNPFVWWIGSRIRAEREHACDDVALAYAYSPQQYAQALAGVETWRAGRYQLGMAFGGNEGSVLQRVRRVLGKTDQRILPGRVVWGSLLLLFALSSTLVMSPLQAETEGPRLIESEAWAANKEPANTYSPTTGHSSVEDQTDRQRSTPIPAHEQSKKAAASSPELHAIRDTLPEPADQNAQQLRQEMRELERQLRKQELEWQQQQLVLEQQVQEQAAAVQQKLRQQELLMSQLSEEAEQARAQLELKVRQLRLQKLELEKEQLQLEQLQEDLQQAGQQAKDEAYIKQLEKTQAARLSIADQERALRKKEMELEKQMHDLEFEMELSKRPLQQQQIEQQQKLHQLSESLEAQQMRLEQQMELKRAKMELKMEKARARYEQLIQRRESMQEEGERMRQRQQRSGEGQ